MGAFVRLLPLALEPVVSSILCLLKNKLLHITIFSDIIFTAVLSQIWFENANLCALQQKTLAVSHSDFLLLLQVFCNDSHQVHKVCHRALTHEGSLESAGSQAIGFQAGNVLLFYLFTHTVGLSAVTGWFKSSYLQNIHYIINNKRHL